MRLTTARILFLLFILLNLHNIACSQQSESERAKRWSFHFEELKIQSLQQRLSKQYQPSSIAFTNLNLITMHDNQVIRGQTVLVQNGKIIELGDAKKISAPVGFQKIDCSGMYMMPGLTDMHVHNLVSSSQHLLNLANGITTVRDMDGFPWMLKVQDQIRNNKLLAPNMYITGQILNERPMDWYAAVVKSPEEGRAIVKQQKKDGYDFIKVHNNLPLQIYSAILDEAQKHQMDVVGHIPHEITIHQAAELGQKTFEHFKGYILDAGLALTNENYVQETKDLKSWNCPTFYTYRDSLRGDAAVKLINQSVEMKYASWRDKQDWLETAKETPDANLKLQQNILPLETKIFKDLLPIYDRWLAGTDSGGGYPFMVPGFSLHEELRIMNENGLTPFQTLKAATINAALAMNRETEFGTIEVGKQANLLILKPNPLQKISNLQNMDAVIVRGIYLSRKDLDQILTEIEKIYNPALEQRVLAVPSKDKVEWFLKEFDALKAEGFIFRDHDIKELQDLLKEHNRSLTRMLIVKENPDELI
jgi:imidazolonepropionase-like amidohydrolase